MTQANWSDDRVEQLKTLWTEGLSASQIARALGGVTRNDVIGKVHRLGLAGRATSMRSERSEQSRLAWRSGWGSPELAETSCSSRRPACREGLTAAEAGHIVTFGVQPERAATEYGYISPGDVISGKVFDRRLNKDFVTTGFPRLFRRERPLCFVLLERLLSSQ